MDWLSPIQFLNIYSVDRVGSGVLDITPVDDRARLTIALILIGIQQLTASKWLVRLPWPQTTRISAIRNTCHTSYDGSGLKMDIVFLRAPFADSPGDQPRNPGPASSTDAPSDDTLYQLFSNTWREQPHATTQLFVELNLANYDCVHLVSLLANKPLPFARIWAHTPLIGRSHLIRQLYPQYKSVIIDSDLMDKTLPS